MAIQVTGYTGFNKRINSTKQPTGGTTITCELKAPCSIEQPVFRFNTSLEFNYFKWGNRYYYVTDITHETADILLFSCNLDVLATYKSDILNTSAFVEYSTSKYSNYQFDPRISQREYTVINSTSIDIWGDVTQISGRFILTVANNEGSATYYQLTRSELLDLGAYLSTLATTSASNATIRDRLERIYGKTFDAILGCIWVPFVFTGATSTTIKIGGEDTGVSCTRIGLNTATVLWNEFTITSVIPYNYTYFPRRLAEVIEIYLPAYGTARINAKEINGDSAVTIKVTYDVTGGIMYVVTIGSKHYYYNCNVGVDVPVTRFVQSLKGMLLQAEGGLIQNAYNSGMASPLAAGILGALGEAGSFLSNMTGRLSNIDATIESKGGTGGAVGASTLFGTTGNVILRCISPSYAISWDDTILKDKYGLALFETTALATLTGFCKCNGASVDIDGYESEKARVNAFMNGGFYIE